VIASSGQLEASHDRPLPALALDAPEIGEIWEVATRAPAIELDLKQSSPSFVAALVSFLRRHRGPQVLVSSGNARLLRTLRQSTPWVRRFLSVRSRLQLEELLVDPLLLAGVQGVSVRQDLLDAGTTKWLKARRLFVLAWVVEDAPRARELARYGVDGIATDNLAVIDLLRGSK